MKIAACVAVYNEDPLDIKEFIDHHRCALRFNLSSGELTAHSVCGRA